jgi:hypothetical protein
MPLNGFGGEMRQHQPKAVTLPVVSLAPDNEKEIEREIAEAALRVSQTKIIRAGLDAWQLVTKAESFDGWLAIGRALAVGKAHALKVSGAKQAWGRN